MREGVAVARLLPPVPDPHVVRAPFRFSPGPMSTRLILAAAALAALPALTPAASAQAAIGLRAGLNVSDFSGDDAPENTDPRLGFSGGLFATIPVGASGLYVQPEVIYTQKGVQSGDDGSGESGTLKLDYIEVPVLLGYAVPVTPSGLMLGAYAGPAVAFKAGESLEFNSELGEGIGSGSIDSDLFRDVDLGAAVGVTVGAGPFAVDGRYTFGLANALDTEDGDLSEVRNNVFTIAATYRFGR